MLPWHGSRHRWMTEEMAIAMVAAAAPGRNAFRFHAGNRLEQFPEKRTFAARFFS